MKSAIVFKDPSATVDSPLPGTEPRNGASSPWERLPLIGLNASEDGTVAGTFNAYWNVGTLTVYVDAVDATKSDGDSVTVRVGDAEYVIGRSSGPAAADVASKVVEGDGGYELVVTMPCPDAVENAAVENAAVGLNVIVKDGDSGQAAAWDTNPTGTVTLVEPLSYTETVQVPSDVEAPKIDADASDAAWDDAVEVALDKVTSGTPEATATAKTLWSDGKLYVLVKVNDADVDLTNSNPYEKDSVEVFIDRGNTKSGQYTDDIQQIRVSADGRELSFGAGAAEDVQKSRVRTAGRVVDGGYVVEMAIDLGEAAAGTFEGVDFQINDAKKGARIGIRNWADPTGAGYQTASHWGVLRLLSDSSEIEIPGGDAEKPGDEKPQPSDDADNDNKMPQTGSAVIGVAVVALLLVAAGCGLVIARRR